MTADPTPHVGFAATAAPVPTAVAGPGPTPTDRAAEATGSGATTAKVSAATGLPVSPVVNGVDVDAVVDAVLACTAVADLDAGRMVSTIATYLPGRQVGGIRVTDSALTLQFVLRWGATVSDAVTQIRSAVGPLADGRTVDLVVSGITDPPSAPVAAG